MSDFIDFESYDLHGDELLAASAIGGLYAMMVTGNYFGSLDFQSMAVRDGEVRINADVVRNILTEALKQMDAAVNSWNPESEMMKGAKRTLQSAELDPELIVSNMSLDFARFLSDLSLQAAA